jgi:monoamine oxidase
VQADYQGHVAELLAKAANGHQLDAELSREDRDKLLESLRSWGALDRQFRYATNTNSSDRRGYAVDPGGGLMPDAVPSEPLDRNELLRSRLWRSIAAGAEYEFQSTIFQPVGGMDQIAMAVYRQVKDLVRFNARVTKIDQSDTAVTVTYADAGDVSAQPRLATADWCICTIPLSILSQIEVTAGQPMRDAIHAVPYAAAFKAGLQFKRKFWEQDEHIYGGISYSDLPINRISYPSTGYGQPGKGVVVGSYVFGPNAFEFSAMTPQERLREVLRPGAQWLLRPLVRSGPQRPLQEPLPDRRPPGAGGRARFVFACLAGGSRTVGARRRAASACAHQIRPLTAPLSTAQGPRNQ